MHTFVDVSYISLPTDKETCERLDSCVSALLGYRATVHEILIAPRRKAEFELARQIKTYLTSNPQNHVEPLEIEISGNRFQNEKNTGETVSFDTIDNTKKRVILELDSESGMYCGIEA